MEEEKRLERSWTLYKIQNAEIPHSRGHGDVHHGMGCWIVWLTPRGFSGLKRKVQNSMALIWWEFSAFVARLEPKLQRPARRQRMRSRSMLRTKDRCTTRKSAATQYHSHWPMAPVPARKRMMPVPNLFTAGRGLEYCLINQWRSSIAHGKIPEYALHRLRTIDAQPVCYPAWIRRKSGRWGRVSSRSCDVPGRGTRRRRALVQSLESKQPVSPSIMCLGVGLGNTCECLEWGFVDLPIHDRS